MLTNEREGLSLGLGQAQARAPRDLGQAAGAVVLGTPLAHVVEDRVGLVNDEIRTLGDDLELGVGDQAGDLEHVLGVRVEPGHLHVDPDQRRVCGHAAEDSSDWIVELGRPLHEPGLDSLELIRPTRFNFR